MGGYGAVDRRGRVSVVEAVRGRASVDVRGRRGRRVGRCTWSKGGGASVGVRGRRGRRVGGCPWRKGAAGRALVGTPGVGTGSRTLRAGVGAAVAGRRWRGVDGGAGSVAGRDAGGGTGCRWDGVGGNRGSWRACLPRRERCRGPSWRVPAAGNECASAKGSMGAGVGRWWGESVCAEAGARSPGQRPGRRRCPEREE